MATLAARGPFGAKGTFSMPVIVGSKEELEQGRKEGKLAAHQTQDEESPKIFLKLFSPGSPNRKDGPATSRWTIVYILNIHTFTYFYSTTRSKWGVRGNESKRENKSEK